ncbi:hypothetical protein QJQ45_015876 [Haematococcus lacustris]|nr:hypothetical protein QJQ45_015876 [Haematococcus lacustris]
MSTTMCKNIGRACGVPHSRRACPVTPGYVLDAAVHALEAEQDNNTDTALRSYAQVKARLCWVKDEVALLDPVELFLLASQQSPCESLAAPLHFGMPHLLMSPPSRTSELLETLQQSEVMALLMEDLQQTDPPASPPASHRAIVKEEQAAVKQHQLQLPPCPHPFARPPTGSYPLREPLLINDTPNSTATLLNVFQSTGVTTSAGHPSPAWATLNMAALHCPSPHLEASTAQEHHFDVQAMQCSPAYAAQPAGHPEHLRCSREGSLDPDAALLQPHQQGQQGHPQQEHSCLLVAGAKAAGMCEVELSSADPVLKELIQQCRRDVWGSLDDLAGLRFQGLRAPPSNFLFYGPPGTGKTMLVEKVAAQAGLTLLCLPPSVLLSKWSGESEKTLRAAFKAAKLLQPCAIFLDEVDSLAPQRGASGSSGEDAASRRLLTELLIQMSALASSAQRRTATGASPRQSPATSDATKRTSQSAREGHGGCSVPASRSAGSAGSQPVRRTGAMLPLDAATLTRPSVYIFAATNRLQDCDTALLRRFERRVHVPLPDIPARKAYFQKVLSKPELAHDIDLASSGPGSSMAQLLAASQGYSCSDLDVIAREAAMAPVREAIDGMEEGDDQHGALQPATSQAAGAAVAAALGEGLPANSGEVMHSPGLANEQAFLFDPATQMGMRLDPGAIQAVSAASGVWSADGCLQGFYRSKLTRSQVQHDSGLIQARHNSQRWNDNIKLELQHLAAASPAGTSLVAIQRHVAVTLATWDAVWGEYRHPKWAEQKMRLHGAQDKVLERYCKQWGTRKQLVVFFGNAGIGNRGGWGAKAVLQACRKVVERPNSGKPTDRPCEAELDSSKPTKPEDWIPKPGHVQHRLLRSAWSKRFEAPVRGLMWCPWLAQATPGDLGKWVDRDCNAALNLQRAGEAKWRPLELCRWPHRGRLPAKGKEYPALGFKKLRDRALKALAQQPVAQWLDRDCNVALNMQRIGKSKWRALELCWLPDLPALPAKGKDYYELKYKRLQDKQPKAQQQLPVAYTVVRAATVAGDVPDMEKRNVMNLILASGVGLPVAGMAVPFLSFFVPVSAGGGAGGQAAKDALGNDVKAAEWLKTHPVGDHSLAQGLKGDPTYLIVNNDGKIENFGVNAVCTHLGCVVPWNAAEKKFKCPCHGSQYNGEGKVVRGPAPLSLALAHADINDADVVIFSTWKETDFRTGEAPWWK